MKQTVLRGPCVYSLVILCKDPRLTNDTLLWVFIDIFPFFSCSSFQIDLENYVMYFMVRETEAYLYLGFSSFS